MTQRNSDPSPSSEAVRTRASGELIAWRLDVGEDAYALLVWPEPTADEAVLGRLTPAEREVARLMGAGLSNATIARRRGSSPRTVANQAAQVFRKLGIRSRLGLYAFLAGGSGAGEGKP